MSREEFVKGMTLLGVAYNKEFNEEQIGVWYQLLKEYSEEEFSRAVLELIKTETHLPTIAHITKVIAQSKTSGVPDAEDEWQDVIRAVRQYGSWSEKEALESLSPYTRKITEYIGFKNICMATPEEQKWNKKEFIEEYNSLKDKMITNEQIGVSERNLLNE